MGNKEQVYSRNGYSYYSYEEIMKELRELLNIGSTISLWEADKKEWKHSDFINIDSVINDMQVQAVDDCGEAAEEYLNEITEDQKKNLEKYIADWFDKNAKLNFYGVENPRKIVVIVE